jgi:hypothetical protein
MKLLFAAGVGFLAGWVYGSERARSEVQRRLNATPQTVQQARESVSGVIDAAPLPRQVKDTATRLTSKARPKAEGEYIGTPGVESASGRDRTKDGDLPPDLATP